MPVVSHLFPSSLPVIKTGITPPSTPQSRLLRVFSGFSGYFIPSSAASLRTVCNVKCSPAVTVDQFDNRIASKRSQPTPTIMTSRPPLCSSASFLCRGSANVRWLLRFWSLLTRKHTRTHGLCVVTVSPALHTIPVYPPSTADVHRGRALCGVHTCEPGWCSCLCVGSTLVFDNPDGLWHQVLADIEPAFPPERLPLTLEGTTQRHFIFRSIIESAPSLKWLHYLFRWPGLFVNSASPGLPEHEVRSHREPSRGQPSPHVFGYPGALQTTRLPVW